MMMMAMTTTMTMHGASRMISKLRGLAHFVDVSVTDPVKKLQDTAAWEFARLWETLEY
jgi:hypothetical protein